MSGALRELLAVFDVEVNAGQLKKAAGDVSEFKSALAEAGKLLAAGAIVRGVKDMVMSTIDLGGSINDTAAKLGIGTSELQRFQFAAQQNGVGADQLGAALGKLNRNIGEAASGNVEAQKAFGAVDFEAFGGGARSATDVMRDFADQLNAAPDQATRAKMAVDLLGKSGQDLLPMLQRGGAGLQEMLDQADKLGGVMNEKTIAALDDAGDALDAFDFSMRGVKAQITLAILPALTSMAKGAASLAGEWLSNENNVKHLQNVLIVVGATLALMGAAAAAPWLLVAIVIAALVLIADDLITALNGGDSATGRLLDKIFGKRAGKSIFKEVRKDLDDLYGRMKAADGPAGAMEEVFSTLGASLVRFFKDDLFDLVGFTQGWSNGVKEAIIKLEDDILAGVLAFPGKMSVYGQDAAKALLDGIVNGIKAGAAAVEKAVTDFAASAIKNPLTFSIDAHSPSKWAEEDFMGTMLFGGLSRGLDVINPKMAAKTSAFATNAIVAPMSAIGAAVGGARSSSLNQTNHTTIIAQGTGVGAVQRGMDQSLGAAGRAALAALETGVA